MSRVRTALAAVSLVVLSLLTFTASAQESPGVITSFTGTLSSSGQVDRIAFDVEADLYELNADGGVDLVFVMSSENSAQAPVDPGLIAIEANGSGSVQKNLRRPDTASSTTSIALATLTPGTYEIVVRSEHKTTGAYRVDVLLAGDANTDFKIDAADLQVIAQLNATKWNDADYSPYADVDRNGVINGGDRQRAKENVGAVAPTPQAENPLDQSLAPGALALVGRSPNAFSSRTGGLRFSLATAEFDNAPADFKLTINGSQVPASALVIEPNLLTANVTLADGRNVIRFKGYDTIGRPLYYNTTIWAGSGVLRVNLVDANGAVFTPQANVVGALSDDASVVAEGIASNGSVTFSNLPGRTILIKAKGLNNEFGTAGAVGNQGSVTIKMLGFNAPSPIANNDISLGTAGWVIGAGSPVSVIPHTENIPGFAKSANDQLSMKVATTSLVDQDIMLGTSGLGERTVSRTFTTEAGTTAVKIRYRFITSEVPGGYFGTQWNDYFRVSLRSQAGGGSANETNSMNGLGLAAFNFSSGETDWREITLAVDRAGDTIQADAAVANVGDGLFQSQVVIDFVEEIRDQVRPALAWNNTAGGLRLTWEVLDRPLENDVTIEVFFASGTGHGDRLGTVQFTHVVPAGTAVGAGGPVAIPGTDLDDDPAGTTHIIAFSSPTMVGSVADVAIAYGGNADPAAVSDRMIDIVKDGLRAAGATTGRITSTARTPADQARAMFNNCLNNGAASQLALYAAAGDAVIRVYIARTQGLTTAQIRAQAGAIQSAMEAEIVAQGPENVSRHCGDPAVRTVIDVGYSSFNATNRPLFQNAVSGRVSRLIDEPNNSCLHLELVL